MQTFLYILAIIAIIGGTFFSFVGVLGYLRLPDVYTKLHAVGKVGVFGVVMLLIAATLWTQLSIWRSLILIFLLSFIGPVTAHALSSAAYRLKVPMSHSVRDDLADKYP
jgi:multicomponent Na+:H+ antiporter subunit G